MSIKHVLGPETPIEVSETKTDADHDSSVIEVIGTPAVIALVDPASFAPKGYTLDTSTVSKAGDGMAKLTVRSTLYGEDGESLVPKRVTFKIDMVETQYELQDHPLFAAAAVKAKILAWLATDDRRKTMTRGQVVFYTYDDENGVSQEIKDNTVIKFCAAYFAGIKTFVRYFPVIDKISILSRPAGMLMNGASFTGGSPAFAADLGHYAEPPLTISGYPQNHWFKSGDNYQQQENRSWTRTEQWTYTPDGSDGSHAWIYAAAGNGGSGNGQGGNGQGGGAA
jgi:hypothetical protein